MNRNLLLACMIPGAVLAGRSAVGAAGKTVWDGVYVSAQAERGQDLYAQHCSACHGDFLDGDGASGRVVALSGDAFADNWESASLNDLFAKIALSELSNSYNGNITFDADTFVFFFVAESIGNIHCEFYFYRTKIKVF